MKKQLKKMENYHWSRTEKFVLVKWFKTDGQQPAKQPLFVIEVMDTLSQGGLFSPLSGIGIGTSYCWGLFGLYVTL